MKRLFVISLIIALSVYVVPSAPNAVTKAIAPIIIAGIVAGVAALASSIIGTTSSKNQMQRTNAANMELAKYQADRNEAFIDKQNAYNTPAEQMKRFDLAGLNPNLMYGQGTPGNQSSPARYEAPTVDMHFTPFQIPEVLGMYQDFQQKQANIALTEANTRYVDERSANEAGVRRELLALTGGKVGFDLDLAKELRKYNVDIKSHEENIMHAKSSGAYEREVMGPLWMNNLLKERIKGQVQQNELLRMENVFKRYEEQFRKMGITNSDNIWVRVLTRMLNKAGIDIMGSLKP